MVEYIEFHSLEELIDFLLEKVKTVTHEEYESVKLYGNSELMFRILRIVFSKDKYRSIEVGYIELFSDCYDKNVADEYVLELSEDEILCIRSAWEGNALLKNDAKFTVCANYCSEEIFENVMEEDTQFVVGDIEEKNKVFCGNMTLCEE